MQQKCISGTYLAGVVDDVGESDGAVEPEGVGVNGGMLPVRWIHKSHSQEK